LALKLPQKFAVPHDYKEAILVMELGFPPDVLDSIPEPLLEKMLVYRNVKNVAQFGGSYDP